MNDDLTNFTGAQPPRRAPIHGHYVDLEPLDPAVHGDDLFAAVSVPDGIEERFRYLPQSPQTERSDFDTWIAEAATSSDPLFFAVVDRSTGRAEGRQALMRIDTANGVMEIGHILWGPALRRTRAATEALFLSADLAFASGFRRFEWKCDDANAQSKAAAERFGFTFEGVFRQHVVYKGRNRDTAWFSIIDSEWPALRSAYEQWLDEANFDAAGGQRQSLRELIAAPRRG
ncbi:GNAT family N-acetyltransferase [Brevibacterium sp. JSBI002]|uniref:GNAT family N-acetyltransferase n=1 Tax=Brevibacterium sp. JSBI002 TaxID=2886045 RepID=UPI00222EFD3D|nr:GNAT family protein [Brevibacterium sp. JSBI002]UZD61405.1 GNAT family N-acetyltransferase [Brevibacterium sp. JSBI002]